MKPYRLGMYNGLSVMKGMDIGFLHGSVHAKAIYDGLSEMTSMDSLVGTTAMNPSKRGSLHGSALD